MDEQTVREHAESFCAALVAGDMDQAMAHLSLELRRNLGEVLALLPLPATEATVESMEHSGSGDNVVLRVVGDAEAAMIQTRWKDRDGKPTIIEASHLAGTSTPAVEDDADRETDLTASI